MVYASFINQIEHLSKFFFAFILIFVFFGNVLFGNNEKDKLEEFIASYIRMVFAVIMVGYLLVILQLYEVISLLFVFFVIYLYKGVKRAGFSLFIETWQVKILAVYDMFEGSGKTRSQVFDKAKNTVTVVKKRIRTWFFNIEGISNFILLTVVLGYGAYLRFYDAVIHAAPAMSDAYVTLAWMKYIEEKILFHDGIYPQGFHIYLSVLHKFAGIDALYILKYTGPFNTVLVIFMLYFCVSRITGNKMAGILSAFIFAALPELLHFELARQSSTNSQEFAMVFFWPGIYFAWKFLENEKRKDFYTASSALAICGLVHSLIFVFLILGFVCLFLVYIIAGFRKYIVNIAYLALAIFLAGIISTFPALIGLLTGKQFHTSSVNFLEQNFKAALGYVNIFDKISLACILVYLVFALAFSRLRIWRRNAISLFLLLILAFTLYYAGGYLTGKALISSRSSSFWGLVSPIAISFALFAVLRIFPQNSFFKVSNFIVVLGIMGAILYYFPANPIEPYKMQSDEMVQQYLNISNNFQQTQWMLIGAEDYYALVLGRGHHVQLEYLLNNYDPTSIKITNKNGDKNGEISLPDIFLVYEKKMYRAQVKAIEGIMNPIYDNRMKKYAGIAEWIKEYSAIHKNISVYYEDADLKIYHIHQEKSHKKIMQELWG